MTRLEALDRTKNVKMLVALRLKESSNDEILLEVALELDRLFDLVSKTWPIPHAAADKISIGLYGVREFEGYDDELAFALEDLSYDLQGE